MDTQTQVLKDRCEQPSCTSKAVKEYKDDKGNSLRLCEKCYFDLVVRDNIAPSIEYRGLPPLNIDTSDEQPCLFDSLSDHQEGDTMMLSCSCPKCTPRL